ncbi:MAG TPA: hypothetical protein VF411_04710, partial [Bacteroidia bacterium]
MKKIIISLIIAIYCTNVAKAQRVNSAMVKYVEDYLGFNIKSNETNNGVIISNVLITNKLKRTGLSEPKIREGTVFNSISINDAASYYKNARSIIDKEDFVTALMEYKKNRQNSLILYSHQDNNWYKYLLKIFDLNIDELVKLSQSTETTISTQNNTPAKQTTTKQTTKKEENISRGGGDAMKGLNVSKTKDVKIASGNYYALIIGIDKYSGNWHPLNTAVHDAQAFQKVLSEKYKI